MGTLHGGVLCELAHAAMGMVFASTLAPSEPFTTMMLNIHCFRPVSAVGRGPCCNRVKNMGYVECEESESGRQTGRQSKLVTIPPECGRVTAG